MKRIFTILSILTVGTVSIAYAANDFTPFTTVEQAQQYCPAVNALTFTPNTTLPNSPGKITGTKGVTFESIPQTAVRPKNLDASNLIQDAQFRSADGLYGYISNKTVTCLYSYTTIYNVSYALVIRGK